MSSVFENQRLPSEVPDLETWENEWTFHHRFLFGLIAGSSGIDTYALHRLYQAVAPSAYHGVLTTPIDRDEQLEHLEDLERAGLIEGNHSVHARVWTVACSVSPVRNDTDLSGDLRCDSVLSNPRPRAVLHSLEEVGPAKFSEIYEEYQRCVEDPDCIRSVRRSLKRLRENGLIETRGGGRGTTHRVAPEASEFLEQKEGDPP